MHNLCHAPGCSAKAVRGWTRCARHYSGGMRRDATDTSLSRLTPPQRRIHAAVQLHGTMSYGYRQRPAIDALVKLGLVEAATHYTYVQHIVVRLPASESARLKGPWRRDELRSGDGGRDSV